MQVPVHGCTFLTLSDRKESTAENRQLSERGSAPIIRALMISALMIGAQQCHPQVPPTCAQQSPTCAQQCTHLCPAVHPPVPLCSVTHLCPEVPPPVPSSATHLCPPSATHLCP
ncbi:unnamed protein product, partial [Staurois parvus]